MRAFPGLARLAPPDLIVHSEGNVVFLAGTAPAGSRRPGPVTLPGEALQL